jgi:UDP-N-acetylmuramoyl-tripeptide--D-alanyl-D-alanine ligase
MTLPLQEVARAMGAAAEAPAVRVAGWSVDTRTQNAGDVYFALHGEKQDGHQFVPAAWDKGASAVVVSVKKSEKSGDIAGERPELLPLQRAAAVSPYFFASGPELLVRDTLRALQDAGAWARGAWGGKVIGVTGSAGKTTTKDAIAQLLAVEMPVGRTMGNLNNHVGVPISILRLPDGCRAAVLEMGMNHAGEIRALAAIARPDIGVVTNVGYAHVEFFDSVDGVAAAKRELVEALPRDGVAVLNGDDARVRGFGEAHAGRSVTFGFSECAEVRAGMVEETGAGTRFRALGVDFETTLPGRHAVMNLLAAIAVAREFGIAPERLREAVRSFAAGEMRGERLVHNRMVVWNDCYNSNPEAAQAMIDVLAGTPAARRFAVLGEMLELGHRSEALHRQVGRYAAQHGVDVLVGVGAGARALVEAAVAAGLPGGSAHYFDEAGEAGDFVRAAARPGDAVLFKGSRGVHVERALERFMA